MASPAEFVSQQFAQAQSYANSATSQLTDFLSVLNSAASYTVPTINLTWETVGAPATVAPPSVPTLDDVTFTAPTEPTAAGLTPVTIDPITFTEVAPTTSFPTAPTLDYGTTPAIPAVADIALPAAPAVSLPSAPTLLTLNIPTFSGVDLHEDWLAKFDDIPTLDLVAPTPYSYALGPEYASTLLSNLSTTLNARLSGGTGLPEDVEQAIWDRARSRETQTALANEADVLRTSDALGFPMPPGVVAAQLRMAQQDYYDKLSTLSRDVAIKQAELEQENMKQTILAGIQLESKLIDYSYQLEQLTFEASKVQAENAIAIYNARVEQYKALLSVYGIYSDAYKTIISAELAKVDVFKGLISAEQAKADINRSLVEEYKAMVEASMAQVEIYKAELDGAKALVEIEGLKINAAGEQIKAYVAQVNAETAKIEAYKAGVEAETAKVQTFKVKADAFAAQAGVQIEAARVGIANLDSQIRAKALEWDGYKAKLSAGEVAMRGLMQGNELLIQKYRTEGDLGVAQYGSAIKRWEAQLKDYEAGKQAMIQVAKINGDQAMHAASVRADAAKAGAQVHAQLVGSAYSIMKVQASVSGQGQTSVQYQYQNSTQTAPPSITTA
jgi:hypothetical protein